MIYFTDLMPWIYHAISMLFKASHHEITSTAFWIYC